MRLYYLEDQLNENETVLIVPIDDKKSINKKYVLKNSDLLKKYFNVPTEKIEPSLNLSNRLFHPDKDKRSQSNSGIMLNMYSHRSIRNQNPSKFKLSVMDSDESNKPISNPFLSQQMTEYQELNMKQLNEPEETRQRRKSSGSILRKAQIPIRDT